MPSIATSLNKRAKRELYSGNIDNAVEKFYRAHFYQPDDKDLLLDLIYALNQKSDYISALQYCYAILPYFPDESTLYFFLAEAFGGIGSASACAQMLEKYMSVAPDGAYFTEAAAFLKDLKEKYPLDQYDKNSLEAHFGVMNTMAEIPFLNLENAQAANRANQCAENGDFKKAVDIIEKELATGNYSITLLGMGIVLAKQLEDDAYLWRCVERFRLIEDYTIYEVRALAYNLSMIGDNEVAYEVYKTLYGEESGEAEIAFGFAVACEKRGEIAHAKAIAQSIALSCGSVGSVQYYLEECGSKTHSYVYRFENESLEKVKAAIESREALYQSNRSVLEAAEYMRYAPLADVQKFILSADVSSWLTELLLRRLALDNSVPLIVRCELANLLYENGKEQIYINTGTSIIVFTSALYSAVFKFLEGNRQ